MKMLLQNNKERQSGIELIKIVAIFLIVISHVTQSLTFDATSTIGVADYLIDLTIPTLDSTNLILFLFRCVGMLGNTLFFVSTCWFLVDKTKFNFRKIIVIYLDIYLISMICLLTVSLIRGFSNINDGDILKSFLPNYFQNNWYATNYLIFCLIYPIINFLLNKVSKNVHLIISICLFVYCFIVAFIFSLLCPKLLTWVSEFLLISYLKKYRSSLLEKRKIFLILLVTSGVLGLAVMYSWNFYGVYKINSDINLLKFNVNNNPFTFIFGFSLFNLVRQIKFSNSKINYVSSLTLFVYLFHENLLIRQYVRVQIWESIYLSFGNENIIIWVLLFSAGLLAISLIISFIYNESIHRFFIYCMDKISEKNKAKK